MAPVIFKELGGSCVYFKLELGKTCRDHFLQNWTCVGSCEWLISDEQKFHPWIMLSATSFEHTSHEEVTSRYPDTSAQNTNWLTFPHIQSPFPAPKAIQPLYPMNISDPGFSGRGIWDLFSHLLLGCSANSFSCHRPQCLRIWFAVHQAHEPSLLTWVPVFLVFIFTKDPLIWEQRQLLTFPSD